MNADGPVAGAAETGLPAAPPTMSRAASAMFACAAGMSVANVYYAQALLDALAAEFSIPHAAIGAVIAATQAGCALALFLLVPLGDLVERRRLMLVQLLLLALALAAVGLARSGAMLLGAMLATGLLGTAMTQGLIAYAASVAGDHERGRIVGATQGGVFIGLLLARAFAGAVSDVAGWRSVYIGAAAAMVALAVLLMRGLPASSRSRAGLGYRVLIVSMFALMGRQRVLQVRGMIALLMFAALNVFWSALVLLLSAPPYGFSHAAIGAFGLVGALGALAAPHAGRLGDRGHGQRVSCIALLVLLAAWLPLSLVAVSIWALLAGILLLDLAGQAIHVTNQGMILRAGAGADAHARLVGAYMLFYATGSGLGAIGATTSYSWAGWRGVCVLGAGISLLALLFWAATRRVGAAGTGAPPAEVQTAGAGR